MRRKPNYLFCFSPPVMIATFLVESALLAYTVVRYRMSVLGRLVVALLALLATFQLAEFQVCQSAESYVFWAKVGYTAIAILPVLGVHLVLNIARKKSPKLLAAAYLSGLLFVALFVFVPGAFKGYVCTGNYNIFQLASPYGGMFFVYYFLWLFAGIGLSWKFAHRSAKKIREALHLQIVGYVCFILPAGVIGIANPQTLKGLPSIMCGFAVLYALILVFGIVPRVLRQK